MNYSDFLKSLSEKNTPTELNDILTALWYDAQGDWDKAHKIVQNISTPAAAHVHAYLHRKEGDDANALYWYNRAGTVFFEGSLDDEWTKLVKKFI